jgi:uncharacterized protein (DUF2336 family)
LHVLKWFRSAAKRADRGGAPAPSYDDAKRIAETGSESERRRLARSQGVPPEFLYFFATDASESVRCAVAENADTPIQADIVLSKDRSDSIRVALAGKIARLIPDLRPDQNEKLAAMASEVLETLAQDQLVQVRSVVSEAVKSLDTIPKPIAMLLARDAEAVVSAPVLEFSPLLDDDDLLGLIAGGLREARLGALARRRGLGRAVSNAVAETGDAVAIPDLLRNETAHIDEDTFDVIMAAPEVDAEVQGLIADRPSVPHRTLSKLARLAGASILEKLRARKDFGDSLYAEIEAAVGRKLEGDHPEEKASRAADADAVAAEVQRLHNEGRLNADAILQAIDGGRMDFVAAALAALGDVPPAQVRRVFSLNSAKSILALSWKCGLPMEAAIRLQTDVAKIPPSGQMRPGAEGGYPLDEDALAWQADLLFSP